MSLNFIIIIITFCVKSLYFSLCKGWENMLNGFNHFCSFPLKKPLFDRFCDKNTKKYRKESPFS